MTSNYDYLNSNSYISAIAEQISVLYSLGILRHKNKKDDPYEEYIRLLLNTCFTEYQMMTMLHDVKVGNETVKDLLIRKGLLQ